MTDVRLDLDGAADAVDALDTTARLLRRLAVALGLLAVRSPVLWPPARTRLVALAAALDGSAAQLRQVRGAVLAADGGGGFGDEVRRGWNDVVGFIGPMQARSALGLADAIGTVALAPWNSWPGWRVDPADSAEVDMGDPGGTFSLRPLDRFAGGGDPSPSISGRVTVAAMVAATGSGSGMAPDEFQLIDHGGRTFTVVLGGVVDLSRPEIGLGPHRSVRDLDVHAVDTAFALSPGDDAYARLVADGVRRAGVPPGSRLLVVGHSYGAAAAIQLAADPVFNGDEYEITHVVATGYHVDPWLPLVAPDTDVLAVANQHDLVVGAERLAGALLLRQPGADHHALVRSFPGGLSDAGHSQDHYVAYLEQTGDPGVGRFLRSVAVGGFARPGEVTAVDISLH